MYCNFVLAQTHRAIFGRKLMPLRWLLQTADAVDPDCLCHWTAIKAALVRIPREHTEAVRKGLDGPRVCLVPSRQVVDQETTLIHKREAVDGSVGVSIYDHKSLRVVNPPPVGVRKV